MPHTYKPSLEGPPLAKAYILATFNDRDALLNAHKDMTSQFGGIDYQTKAYPASGFLSPYQLSYRYVSVLCFDRPIKREELVDFRQRSMLIESKHRDKHLPRIELDPGYLTPYSVVHTVLSDGFHHIYLYGGIYAESLYYFEKNSFRPYTHTQKYLHATKAIISAFNDIRMIHLVDQA